MYDKIENRKRSSNFQDHSLKRSYKNHIPNVAVVSEKEANRMSHANAILSLTFEIVFFELEVQITEPDLSKTRSNQNCQNSKCTVI